MGNSNSADVKSKNLKSPRKRFLKGKRLKFKGRGSFTDITDKDQGQEVLDPQCIELVDDEQVHSGCSDVKTEENPQSGSLHAEHGGEYATEERSVSAKCVEGVRSDDSGDREQCINVITQAINYGDKCAQEDTIEYFDNSSDDYKETSVHVGHIQVHVGDRESVKNVNKDQLPETTNHETSESVINQGEKYAEIRIEIDADKDDNQDDDVTEDLTNTSYTDPLITTPYFSPDEEFDNIFDSNPKLNEMEKNKEAVCDIQTDTDLPAKKNSFPDKDMLKPSASSFTVIKHKKVELSPTTFPSPKSNTESKGKLGVSAIWHIYPFHRTAKCKSRQY